MGTLLLWANLIAPALQAANFIPELTATWPELSRVQLRVRTVAISASTAFLGTDGGLVTMDTSKPGAPRRLGAFDSLGPEISRIVVADGLAFVASGGSTAWWAPANGLDVIDVSDPGAPRWIGDYDTAQPPSGLCVVGNKAYLLLSWVDYAIPVSRWELHVLDLSDPGDLRRVGFLDGIGSAQSLAGANGHLYVAGNFFIDEVMPSEWNGLMVMDVSSPASPQIIGRYNASVPPYIKYCLGVAVTETVACLAAENDGLLLVDISNPASPKKSGAFNTSGTARSVTVSNNLAFVADGDAGVSVIDISNPSLPRRIGAYNTSGDAREVALSNNQALVADASGLVILNVSNPASLQRVSEIREPGSARSVQVAGTRAYLADGEAGLRIFDISDPKTFRQLGRFDTTGWADDVAISGSYAYVADGSSGLQVIDISNPELPRRVAGYKTPGSAVRVRIAGDKAYIVDWSEKNSVVILDISNPLVPRRLGSIVTANNAMDVAITGPYACVAENGYPSSSGALSIFDVSTPASPAWLGSYNTGTGVRYIAVSGHLACLAVRNANSAPGIPWELQWVDVSDPAAPALVGRYSTFEVSSLAFEGNRVAFVANGDGLQILDVSDPSRPIPVDGSRIGEGSYGLAISNGKAYIASWILGLVSVDLSSEANLKRIGHVPTTGFATSVAGSGRHPFVGQELWFDISTTQGGHVELLDWSNPAQPQVLASLPTQSAPLGIAVSGDLLLSAENSAPAFPGLQVAQLGTPPNLQPLGRWQTAGAANGVCVLGNFAYVADETTGLAVIDYGDPSNPAQVASLPESGPAWSVGVNGTNAYVAGAFGLTIADISKPSAPRWLGRYNTAGLAVGVAVSGSLACILCSDGELTVLDVQDGTNPRPMGTYRFLPGPAWGTSFTGWYGHRCGIAIAGRYAYVATGGSGVQVIDLIDPSRPRLMGGNASMNAYDLAVVDDHLLVAGAADGFGVFELFQTPLRLEGSKGTNDGQIDLLIDGPAGSTAKVQRSTDLSRWEDWQTVTLGEAPITVTDTLAGQSARGFYRAVSH